MTNLLRLPNLNSLMYTPPIYIPHLKRYTSFKGLGLPQEIHMLCSTS